MRYLFEQYVFDTDRRELHRGADVIPVTPQVFDLLDYLIRNRERVVSKDDLINVIWNGRSVSDSALTTRLNAARIAIGDSGEQQRLIKTLPRKGFRFVGTVREAHGQASGEIAQGRAEPPKPALTLPDEPSIAVLPFANLSSDAEQEYFADGVVEDITMALSLFRWLFVIARNSSFAYKGRAVDVKQIGRELGVRYVLEGSVRKAGNRIRIAGQLIDTETGAHLWADHFDGAREDVFDLQDRVTASVVGAIAPKLQQAEIKRAKHKPTENLDAYDYYLRGLAKLRWWRTREVNGAALELFLNAIELDPGLACAYGMAAWCYTQRKARGWMIEREHESMEAARLAWAAVRLGANDPVALSMGGYALAFVAREFDAAATYVDRGLAINPNHAQAWILSAWLRVWRSEPDRALEHAAHAIRLSPLDPYMANVYVAMAYAHFLAGRYDAAWSTAEKAMHDPTFLLAFCVSAASNALVGRIEQAKGGVVRALECNPDLRASSLEDLAPFRRAEDLATFARGLREAGLPG